jgi:hypothetical protein
MFVQTNDVISSKWCSLRSKYTFEYEFKIYQRKLERCCASFGYNAERSHLIIPEYGRHLQKLIDQATKIEDDLERNKAANHYSSYG